ncbi:MAG: hypothetical protein ACREXI_01710, partial [Caldimonas sp.]
LACAVFVEECTDLDAACSVFAACAVFAATWVTFFVLFAPAVRVDFACLLVRAVCVVRVLPCVLRVLLFPATYTRIVWPGLNRAYGATSFHSATCDLLTR